MSDPDRRTEDERAMAEVVFQLRAESKMHELRAEGLKLARRTERALFVAACILAFAGMFAARLYGESIGKRHALAWLCPAPVPAAICRDTTRGASQWGLDIACPHEDHRMVLSRDPAEGVRVSCRCERHQESR